MSRVAAAVLLLAACVEHGQTPTDTVIVSPVLTPCLGFIPQMCMTMVPDQKPMETLFFGIEGYSHRWGIESEITIKRERLDPIPADGPSEVLTLLETIVEHEVALGSFDIDFPAGPRWFEISGSSLDLHGTPVTVEATLRDQIIAADQSGLGYTVTFELSDTENFLLATGVTP